MIAIIGCGTLGSRVAQLVRDEELVLFDHDIVQPHNVGIQLYEKKDVGKQKAIVLGEQLAAESHVTFIDHTNISLLDEAEVVVDCTDNLLTRELLGAYCYREGIPLVHGAAARNKGIAALFTGTPCMASLYAGKISIDTCRSTEIDLDVADRVAAKQAALVQRAVQDEGHDGVHLITASSEEVVRLSPRTEEHCTKEVPEQDFYITYCTQAGCFAAKPLRKMHVKEGEGEIDGIRYKQFPNGEIHFFSDLDIDALAQRRETFFTAARRSLK